MAKANITCKACGAPGHTEASGTTEDGKSAIFVVVFDCNHIQVKTGPADMSATPTRTGDTSTF